MELIKIQFYNIVEGNPNWSSYLCFTELCQKIKMTPYEIRKWFSSLVDKEDYIQSESGQIQAYLCEIPQSSKPKAYYIKALQNQT